MTRIDISNTVRTTTKALGPALAVAALSCQPSGDRAHVGGRGAPPVPAHQPAAQEGIATLHAKVDDRPIEGTVSFEQTSEGVTVSMDIRGLEPGSMHAVHVHENGDCSAPDASSAGGHFAPHGHGHALPPVRPRHAGDMGNVRADRLGRVVMQRTFETLSLSERDRSIVGRAVIVHAEADRGTEPAGDAGNRIACGVIGVTSHES